MNEDLLQFIWKFRLFDFANLETVQGEPVKINNPGTQNHDSGADFQNAKVRIGKVLWAGNVELHLKSTDWNSHSHNNDPAYNNVILHVVYKHNGSVRKMTGEEVPVLELQNRINPAMLSRYKQLMQQQKGVPCSKTIGEVDGITISNTLQRMMVERLEDKVASIETMLEENGGDWENMLFSLVAKYFGASVNKEPFYLLAKSLPINIWAKHAGDPLQVEALVFGQAGFLNEKWNDDYPAALRKEYLYLKRLHRLESLDSHLWKFLRLRPSNFPTIRLAQLAAFLCLDTKIFSKILNTESVKGIYNLFNVEVNPYWKAHYRFDKPTTATHIGMGDGTKNVLLINAVAPALFAYGKYKDDEAICQRAVQLLEMAKPEVNAVVKLWKQIGVEARNAAETQALLQLKLKHCDKFDCLNCAIGYRVLAKS